MLFWRWCSTRCFCFALLLSVIASPVWAAGQQYIINFEVTAGGPTAGSLFDYSFIYDPLAPIGAQFSSFIVDWDASYFDLTRYANSPQFLNADLGACIPSNDSVGVFDVLTSSGNCASLGWDGSKGAGAFSPEFELFVQPTVNSGPIVFLHAGGQETSQTPFASASASGIFWIGSNSPQIAPEPSEAPAFVVGASVLAIIRRFRSGRASNT